MSSTFFALSRAATKHQPLVSTQMLEAGSVSEEFLGLLEDAVYAGHSILPIYGGADFIDLVEAWKTKGKKLSAAHRKAISDALKGKKKGGMADDDGIPGAVKAATGGFNAKKAKPGDTVQTPDGPAKITKVHGQAWVQVEGAKKKWYKSSELTRPKTDATDAAKKPDLTPDAPVVTTKKSSGKISKVSTQSIKGVLADSGVPQSTPYKSAQTSGGKLVTHYATVDGTGYKVTTTAGVTSVDSVGANGQKNMSKLKATLDKHGIDYESYGGSTLTIKSSQFEENSGPKPGPSKHKVGDTIQVGDKKFTVSQIHNDGSISAHIEGKSIATELTWTKKVSEQFETVSSPKHTPNTDLAPHLVSKDSGAEMLSKSLYHHTTKAAEQAILSGGFKTDSFSPPMFGHGVYLTPHADGKDVPGISGHPGARLTVQANVKKPLVFDSISQAMEWTIANEKYGSHTMDMAKALGYDAVVIKGGKNPMVVLGDPAQAQIQPHSSASAAGQKGLAHKPVMTADEAEAWAKDSVLKNTFYHGTKNGAEIKAGGFDLSQSGKVTGGAGFLGAGVYLSTDKSLSDGYGANKGGETLPIKINVKKMMSADEFTAFEKQHGQIKLSATAADEAAGVFGPRNAAKLMQSMGYDGVHFVGKSGITETVVFDPKNVVVIDGAGKAKKLPHADELTIEHGLGGSTGAKLAKDADGNQYVIKYGASKEHAAAEAAANDVYAAMGVKVPKGHLDKDGAVVNEFLAGGVALANVSGMARSDAYKQLGQHFVLDAVLGNRDVVGPDKMNVLVKDGVAYRIDNGSTFDFRAQGSKKEFTANVGELASLRDPKINPTTAEVYKHLTDSDIRKQALELHANRQKILDATPEQYRKVVSDRIDDVLAKTGATAPQTAAPATPTTATSAVKHWKDGVPGDKVAHPWGGDDLEVVAIGKKSAVLMTPDGQTTVHVPNPATLGDPGIKAKAGYGPDAPTISAGDSITMGSGLGNFIVVSVNNHAHKFGDYQTVTVMDTETGSISKNEDPAMYKPAKTTAKAAAPAPSPAPAPTMTAASAPTAPTSATKTSGQNGQPIGAGDTVQYQGTSKKRYSVVDVDPKDGALTLKDHATGNIVTDMNPMSFNKVNSSAAAVTPKMTVDSDPAKGQAMPANKVTALHKKSEILAAHPVGSKIITANGTELTVTGATTGYVETTGGSKKYYKLTDLASEGATHGAKASTTPSAATGPKYKTKNGTELEVGDEITTPLLTKYKVLAVNADGSATLQKTADLVDPNGPDVGKITHNVPAGKLADDTAAGITKSAVAGPKATLASGETVGAGDTVHFGPSQYKVTQVHDDGSTTMQVVKAASTEKVGDTFKIHPQDAGLYADSVTPAAAVSTAPTKPAHKVGDWVDTADGPAKITAIGSGGYPQFTNPKTGIPDTTHPDNVTPIKAKTFMAPSGSVTHLKQYHPVGSIISTPDGDFKVAKHYTGYVGVEGAPKKNYKIEDLKTHAATAGSTASSASSAVPAAAFKNAAGAAVLSKSGSHVTMGDTLQTKTGATYEVVGQTADGKISLKHTKSGKVYDNDPGYVTNFMTHAPGSGSAPSPAATPSPTAFVPKKHPVADYTVGDTILTPGKTPVKVTKIYDDGTVEWVDGQGNAGYNSPSVAKTLAKAPDGTPAVPSPAAPAPMSVPSYSPPPGPVQKAAGSLGIIPQGLPHAYQPDGVGPSLPTTPKKSIVDEAAEKVTPAPGHVSSYGSTKYDADKPPAVGQAVYHTINNKAAVVDKIDSSTGAKIAHVTYSDGTKGTVDLGGGQQLKAYDAQKAKTGGYSASGASDASPFTPMPGWPTKYVKGENTKHDPTWIKQQNAAVAMLPEGQKTAIKDYAASAFSAINDTLRLEQTPKPATAAKIKALDQAMANARTDRDIIVYRGIGADIKTGKPVELKVGEIFTDKGYMSTSISKGSEFSGSTKFEILLPTGSRAIYAKAVSSYPHEDELLIGRNTRFIVHEIIQKGYERLVRMEALVD